MSLLCYKERQGLALLASRSCNDANYLRKHESLWPWSALGSEIQPFGIAICFLQDNIKVQKPFFCSDLVSIVCIWWELLMKKCTKYISVKRRKSNDRNTLFGVFLWWEFYPSRSTLELFLLQLFYIFSEVIFLKYTVLILVQFISHLIIFWTANL